jgi:hypothetical protein
MANRLLVELAPPLKIATSLMCTQAQIDRVVCLDGSGALTTGTVTFQLDGGNDLSLDDFNTAVAPIPESEYRNNDHDMTFGLSLANNLVGSVEIFYK